jgi:hypothetical protein
LKGGMICLAVSTASSQSRSRYSEAAI